MAEEALACFESLLKSVPCWIADLEDVLRDATRKQNELLSAHQPTEAEFERPPLLRKASKSSSLRSRPRDDEDMPEAVLAEEVEVKQETPEPTLLRPQLPHMTNSDALRLAQRKRKTASVCSRDQSGPSKFRSRSMVVIYYDGDVQKKFESIVRTVGTRRNSIRKGKMSLRVDNLVRSGSSSSDSASSAGEETIKGMGTFTYKTTRTMYHESAIFGRNDGSEAFDNIDILLEKAQSLVERAAHQVLRDGDCMLEVNKAKEHLATVQTSAESELPSLEKKAEKAAIRRKRSEERLRAQKDESDKLTIDKSGTEKVQELTFLPTDGQLEVDTAETDEDSDSDGDFNLGSMQLPPSLNKISMRATSQIAAR